MKYASPTPTLLRICRYFPQDIWIKLTDHRELMIRLSRCLCFPERRPGIRTLWGPREVLTWCGDLIFIDIYNLLTSRLLTWLCRPSLPLGQFANSLQVGSCGCYDWWRSDKTILCLFVPPPGRDLSINLDSPSLLHKYLSYSIQYFTADLNIYMMLCNWLSARCSWSENFWHLQPLINHLMEWQWL